MASHMKTTVEISDALLREAKRVAARDETTVRALIEEGLRQSLNARNDKRRFRMRDVSYGRGGLRPEVEDGSWERLRDLIYEGPGG